MTSPEMSSRQSFGSKALAKELAREIDPLTAPDNSNKSERDMLLYIAAMLTELTALSRHIPQPVLSYLLEMAREEARRGTRKDC
jgi:hypothetical protein